MVRKIAKALSVGGSCTESSHERKSHLDDGKLAENLMSMYYMHVCNPTAASARALFEMMSDEKRLPGPVGLKRSPGAHYACVLDVYQRHLSRHRSRGLLPVRSSEIFLNGWLHSSKDMIIEYQHDLKRSAFDFFSSLISNLKLASLVERVIISFGGFFHRLLCAGSSPSYVALVLSYMHKVL
jgi:hypothetical protein